MCSCKDGYSLIKLGFRNTRGRRRRRSLVLGKQRCKLAQAGLLAGRKVVIQFVLEGQLFAGLNIIRKLFEELCEPHTLRLAKIAESLEAFLPYLEHNHLACVQFYGDVLSVIFAVLRNV